MKFNTLSFACVLSGLVAATSAAYAAPVGVFACTGSSSSLSVNVSHYDIGVTNTLNIGSQSSGAGAGKVTFQPLELYVALSSFPTFFQLAAAGTASEQCTLTSTLANGTTLTFTFKLVAVQSVDAIASSGPHPTEAPPAYADVKLMFGSVEIKSVNANDDGGTPPTGWNRVTNTPNGSVNPR